MVDLDLRFERNTVVFTEMMAPGILLVCATGSIKDYAVYVGTISIDEDFKANAEHVYKQGTKVPKAVAKQYFPVMEYEGYKYRS